MAGYEQLQWEEMWQGENQGRERESQVQPRGGQDGYGLGGGRRDGGTCHQAQHDASSSMSPDDAAIQWRSINSNRVSGRRGINPPSREAC